MTKLLATNLKLDPKKQNMDIKTLQLQDQVNCM